MENPQENSEYTKWKLQAEWKTKEIYEVEWHPDLIIMKNKNDISAWDWARKEDVEWKAKASTIITSKVFEYLNVQSIPTHFIKKLSDTEMLVQKCYMIPLEVICRYAITGSYLSREKALKWEKNAPKEWTILEEPMYELFYKNDVILEDWTTVSDPLIQLNNKWFPELKDNKLILLDPKTWLILNYLSVINPSTKKELTKDEIDEETNKITSLSIQISYQTAIIFESLKELNENIGLTTFDWKIEFWTNITWELVLADVIDADSCRLREVFVVEWEDWKNYLTQKFKEDDFQNLEEFWVKWKDKKPANYWEEFEVLPEWMWIKRIIAWKALDKQWFREWEKSDETLRKYQRLAGLYESEPVDNIIKNIKSKVKGNL